MEKDIKINDLKNNLNILLLFYFITSFGSILGMISTFIQTENTFGNLSYLAWALSLRTLVSITSSLFAPHLFSKFGFRKVLIASEVSGILALLALFYGMTSVNFLLVITALSFMAVPSNLLSQGVISVVRLGCGEDSDSFKKYSSRINKVMGIMDVFIGLMSPAILALFSIKAIYLIDFFSYFLGLGILWYYKKCFDLKEKNKPELIQKKFSFNFKFKYYRSISGLFGTLILIGLVPMIAGSKDFVGIYKSSISSSYFISALWATEGVGFFFSGYLYGNKKIMSSLKILFSISLLLILISALLKSYLLLILGCVWVTISYDVTYKSKRDEALLSAGNNKDEVLIAASSFSIMRSLFCSLSPFVIVLILKYNSVAGMLSILFTLQVLLYLLSFIKKINIQLLLAPTEKVGD